MTLTFRWVDSEYSRLPSIVWLDLIQSLEGLNRKRMTSLEEGGLLPADGLQTWNCNINFSLVLQPAAYPEDFELGNLHIYVSQFLKTSPSLSTHIYTSTHPHTHIFIVSLSLESPNTHIQQKG